MEYPGEPPGLSQVVPTGTTSTAGAFGVSQPHVVQNFPSGIFCASVLVGFQAHGMVKITGRRHDRSPLVSVCGNSERDTVLAAIFL